MLTLVLLAAATPAPATPSKVPNFGKPCAWSLQHADRDKTPARARKLNEMPPANQILTVYREVDGCPKPVVVRREIGGK